MALGARVQHASSEGMPAQLSVAEQRRVDDLVRNKKKSGAHAVRALNAARARRGVELVEQKAVYSYIRGQTHVRGRVEKRGAKTIVEQKHIRKLMQTRRRLVKAADGEVRVTWSDVINEADLDVDCCQKTIEDAVRESTEPRYRPARAKVSLADTDARLRKAFAQEHLSKRASFWSNSVHGDFDCKLFPLPLTPAQRKRFKQTRVVGHLRLPSEGCDRGFTKPRQKHSWVGMPSINVAAVVSRDRIVFWKVVEGNWNGERAAETYAQIGKVLQKRFGDKRQYILVEDGDRKGNQSNKGKAAKTKAKIRPLVLPPRTPSLMPLDYSIWNAVLEKMAACEPSGREARAAFVARLRRCAMSLSRSYVASVVGRMKENLQALKDSSGYTPKND